MPEGYVVPNHNVLLTIVNTDPACFWLTSFLETAILRASGDEKAFALEISNDVAAPVFRNGHVVVVSLSAELRKGDPVVIKNDDGCQVMKLARQTAKKVELKPFNNSTDNLVVGREELEWIARIVWVRH